MQLQRWIIPASIAAILISLAALTILLAANSAAPGAGVAQQEPEQVEEPEAQEPEPAPEPEPQPEPDGADPESPEPEGLDPENPGSEDGALGEPDAQEDQAGSGDPGEQAQEDEDTPEPAIQPGPRTATIEILGDSAYYCSAGIIGDPRTVEGRRPTTYEVDVSTGGTALETVMAACQKISPGGALGVNILYDGEVVAQGETENRLGTVAVSWSPLEEGQ